jgi:hypothetical protein
MRIHFSKLIRSLPVILIWNLAVLSLPMTVSAQSLKTAVEGLDGCAQNLDMRLVARAVAEVLKLDKAFTVRALVMDGRKCSDLVFVKTLASKTKQTPRQVYDANPRADWVALLIKEGVVESDLIQSLDDTYVELAFRIMDLNGKKGAARRS